jgi:drug/metabolite transporter (DMT)-like permease
MHFMAVSENQRKKQHEGLIFGLLGVLGFSLTLPATRVAVESLDPLIVGWGRALVAACFAVPLLLLTRQKWPTPRQWQSIAVVMFGVVAGFPLLSAWAMQSVPASHGAVVLGLIPLATAFMGSLRAHEKPSPAFWLASSSGSLVVIAYALHAGAGDFRREDSLLIAAVLMAAVGYAEGAKLAKELGSWQVVCWALLLSVPVLTVPVAFAITEHGLNATPASWLGFAYVSLISMFLGFFAWYRGLAVGGVARVSQLQLLQPFLTQGFAVALLGENITAGAVLSVAAVAMSIFFSRRSAVQVLNPPASPTPAIK